MSRRVRAHGPARRVFGDVLGERARRGAHLEDAGDGAVLEGAEALCVPHREGEVVARVALAQQQNLPCLIAPLPRAEALQTEEEFLRVVAEVLEGRAQVIEVGAATVGRAVHRRGRDVDASAARRELVAHQELDVGRVDEELALGHADGQEVVDGVVGDGVSVAIPRDEAVDGADAIGHARGVVGVQRQRLQVRRLLGEEVDHRALELLVHARVADLVVPERELRAEVLGVAKLPPVEEAALVLPEASLDLGLVVGAHRPTRHGTETVVGREGEEARVVEGLGALVAEHDGLLVVVLALRRHAAQALEGRDVGVHERVQVAALVRAEDLATTTAEHEAVDLHREGLPVDERDGARGPVALGHLAEAVHGRRQARRDRGARPHLADVILDGRVAARVALVAERLEDALRGDVLVLAQKLRDALDPRRDLGLAWCSRRLGGQRVVGSRQGLGVLVEDLAHGVAGHVQRPPDGASAHALPREHDDLMNELLAATP